jgi:lipoyl(octanoyl) transferase
MHIHLLHLGRISYAEGLAVQQRAVAARKAGTIGDVLLLLEHPPVLTLGIIDLRGDLPGKKGPHLGPVDYVRLLEEVLVRTCGEFGVMAQRIPKRTGVWTIGGGNIQEKKIAAIGVHVSQGVTSHGFALNVTTDLRDFAWIVPCGIADREVTSLEVEAETAPTMQEAINATAKSFGKVFGRQMLGVASVEELLGE